MSDPTRCRATGKDGAPCKNHPVKDSEFCRWHRATVAGDLTLKIEDAEQVRRIVWMIYFVEALQGHFPHEEWEKVIAGHGLQHGLQVNVLLSNGQRHEFLLPMAGNVIFVDGDQREQLLHMSLGPSAPQRLAWGNPWLGACPRQFTFPELLQASERGGSFIPAFTSDHPRETPCLGFFFAPGPIPIILAHEAIPIRADGLPDLRVLTTPREEWDALGVETSSEAAKRGPGRPKQNRLAPLANNGIIRVESSRIESHVIRALSPGGLQRNIPDELARKLGTGERWWAGIPVHSESKRAGGVDGLIGLPHEPDAALWDFLQRNGPLAVKAQIALWARVYAETDAEPGRFVTQSISEFCDALGYTRKKGAHERGSRERAIQVLQLLTQLELMMFHRGIDGKTTRLRGPIWTRGLLGEELDSYADLFGAAREGSPSEWVQVGFSYAPGHWFQNLEWRTQNRSFALVGEGLLGLRPDRDQAAILVGGYLATQARIGRYAPKRLKLATIAERSGLLAKDSRNPGRAFDAVERALDRLVETSVVGDWRRTDAKDDEPDMDNPEDLACLANLAENRRRAVLEITWPAAVLDRAKGVKAHR